MNTLGVGGFLKVIVCFSDSSEQEFKVKCRIDTPDELSCFNQGGILCSVLAGV